MKQLSFFLHHNSSFGGSLLQGKRKSRRPLDSKYSTHFVLKAHDPCQLLRHISEVEAVLRKYTRRFGIKIYECGVHADHIHLAARISRRDFYVKWIRAVTSILVQKIPGLKWRLRPFSRISAWGWDFKRLCNYVRKNRFEGLALLDAHLMYENSKKKVFEELALTMRIVSV